MLLLGLGERIHRFERIENINNREIMKKNASFCGNEYRKLIDCQSSSISVLIDLNT